MKKAASKGEQLHFSDQSVRRQFTELITYLHGDHDNIVFSYWETYFKQFQLNFNDHHKIYYKIIISI